MEWTLYASAVFLAVYLVALTVRRLRFRRDRARMTREARAGGKVVAGVEEVPAGTVKKFWLICGKFRVDCFVINHRGRFHAYINIAATWSRRWISCATSSSATTAVI